MSADAVVPQFERAASSEQQYVHEQQRPQSAMTFEQTDDEFTSMREQLVNRLTIFELPDRPPAAAASRAAASADGGAGREAVNSAAAHEKRAKLMRVDQVPTEIERLLRLVTSGSMDGWNALCVCSQLCTR